MSDRYKGAILSPTAPTVTPQSAGGIYTSSQQLQYQGQGVWPSAFNNPINNSLRFRSSASAYLSRTPASAGNRQTWTYSAWVKRGAVNAEATLLSGGATTGRLAVFFDSTGKLVSDVGGTGTFDESTAVYRDPSAWYHFVWQFDTTQATAANRSRMYINGVQVSLTNTRTFSQNTNYEINNSSLQTVGTLSNSLGGYNLDGYLAEVNFIDGVALTPSSFGTTDAYGIWQPIPYTGAYGTNGFYLPFTDNSALTTSSNVGLGKDFSGNGNYWVTNNISITAGSTYDSMKDVPTNTNSNTANYPTLNPLSKSSSANVTGGNLNWSSSAYNYQGATSTTALPSSGKWYWETFITTGGTATSDDMGIGVQALSFGTAPKDNNTITDGAVIVSRGDSASRLRVNNTSIQIGTSYSFTTNDIIQVAFDADSGKIWFGKNNSYFDASGGTTGNPGSGTNQVGTLIAGSSYLPVWDGYTNTYVVAVNFGQRPFSYTPPTGFYPLNTYNLPTPTILAGNQYMDALLYTGNGSASQRTDISWTNIQPDMVWVKSRSNAYNNDINDDVRGVTQALCTNSTAVEDGPVAFGSDGFGFNGVANQLRIFTSDQRWNANAATYVAWGWKGSGAAGVSNTQGTITSTVSANTTAGFSIVVYTGNGTNGATVGHGLGVKPALIIEKGRTTTLSWPVQGCGVLWSDVTKTLFLDTTGALNSGSGVAAPTSTVFTPSVVAYANESGISNVAYVFAPVAGYSAFGSYTGNGSTDGPFIYTGFRPRYVLIKRTDTTASWYVYDTVRQNYNAMGAQTDPLLPNSSSAEGGPDASWYIDALSNGFKIRNASNFDNNSSGTYIYACFAENPFKISRAR